MRRRDAIAGLAGGAAALVAGVTAGLYRFTDLFVKHYPPTPYDDVLARLTDRERAAAIGARANGPFDVKAAAARLRTMLGGGSLAAAADAEVAAGRVTELDGWVLPESVALLAMLAARV